MTKEDLKQKIKDLNLERKKLADSEHELGNNIISIYDDAYKLAKEGAPECFARSMLNEFLFFCTYVMKGMEPNSYSSAGGLQYAAGTSFKALKRAKEMYSSSKACKKFLKFKLTSGDAVGCLNKYVDWVCKSYAAIQKKKKKEEKERKKTEKKK